MKTIRLKNSSHSAPPGELATLRTRLAEAEATLRAIRTGEVDTVMVGGKEDSQVFTLEGANLPYRRLIESMNEGALTLTGDKTILYANQCFAGMIKCPLEQVTGSSFRRFLSAADQASLRKLMKQAAREGSKIQMSLRAGDGSRLPVQLAIRELANKGSKDVIIGMVVTDLTESCRTEEQLRTLTHRVVQAQEAERGRVALELHDHITQLLCAVLVRSQTLADQLSPRDQRSKNEATQLRDLLGGVAGEVERISRNLRPGVLEQLGLVAVLQATSEDFTERTGVPVELTTARLTARLAADIELTLYRILQEAFKNVELHARARHVVVKLARRDGWIQLNVSDDGIGFDTGQLRTGRGKKDGGLGLLGMRERAAYAGGEIKVSSVRRAGTQIEVWIPLRQARPDRR